VTPGSEFRRTDNLSALLSSHPVWPKWLESLSNGAQYPIEPYSDEEMALDLQAQVEQGNHKSALSVLGVLDELNKVDMAHGYTFCLPVKALKHLKGAAVAPHGVFHQGTMNELGQLITKGRPTHNLFGVRGSQVDQRSMHHGPSYPLYFRPCPPTSDPLHFTSSAVLPGEADLHPKG
jgi:hypothetical protein